MLSAANCLGLLALYIVWIAIYRLYFSPLARVPGPKIAAITSWYCAYHDIINGGRYIWVVEEMHRKYGPVVRIMPNVVHVNDPSFIRTLYSGSPKNHREQAQTVLNMFHTDESVMSTRGHTLHAQRRKVLAPFFSRQNVLLLAPGIQDTAKNLLRRTEGWAQTEDPVLLKPAFQAATKDVIQTYAFGEGERCLDMEDLNAAFFKTLNTGRGCHINVHFHWLAVLFTKLPPAVIFAISPNVLSFARFVEGLSAKIEDIKRTSETPNHRTIFHSILSSDLPDSEKRTSRLESEAMVLAIAGADTTASTLTCLVYRVLSDKAVFKRLRAELDAAMPDEHETPDPTKLDRLPYFNAVIEEVLRLHPGASLRQDRVAPFEDMCFEYPDGRKLVLPAGTIVGMTAPLINRHASWHENPDIFDPNRHLESPAAAKRNLTFSKGVRQCLGINLAYVELQIFTAAIFRKYSIYDPELKRQAGPTMELYKTDLEDITMYADCVTPSLRPGTTGVRVRIRHGVF
ncbi:Cytochrome P450 monooxygenase sdnE [Penicillium malachiteum]|nr:Cytochrome P450 monooxygenase sdnE [Penicillium malachiteum]